jgi:hypothetical protein
MLVCIVDTIISKQCMTFKLSCTDCWLLAESQDAFAVAARVFVRSGVKSLKHVHQVRADFDVWYHA